jgi:DNA-binding CsgD family transcriptional regulator
MIGASSEQVHHSFRDEGAGLSGRDAERVRALHDMLGTWTGATTSALPALLSEVAPLLGAAQFFGYGLTFDGRHTATEFMHATGAADDGTFFSSWLSASGAPRYGLFDPRRPESSQRNVALRLQDMEATRATIVKTPSFKNAFSFYGIEQSDQLRALICDGPALLGWVGGFRPEAFTLRERRVFQALIPALRRRLTLERNAREAALDGSAMAATLEAIPAAAFLVTRDGALRHANEVGRAIYDREKAALRSALRAALQSELHASPRRFDLTKITRPGLPEQYLAVMRAPAEDPAARLSRAAARWSLTPRQTEVLALLVEGRANKTIAATLGCAEGTIELHVSALLQKTQCGSRAELVARFWTSL